MNAAPRWLALRRRLEAARASVAAEIRGYPAPIPACDAQFNHLLEQRRLLSRELARLEAARTDPTRTVEDFVRASPVLDGTAVREPAEADSAP